MSALFYHVWLFLSNCLQGRPFYYHKASKTVSLDKYICTILSIYWYYALPLPYSTWLRRLGSRRRALLASLYCCYSLFPPLFRLMRYFSLSLSLSLSLSFFLSRYISDKYVSLLGGIFSRCQALSFLCECSAVLFPLITHPLLPPATATASSYVIFF